MRFREVMLPKDPQVVRRVGCWSAFRISIPPLASFPLSHQALSSTVRIQVLHPDTVAQEPWIGDLFEPKLTNL